MSGLDDLLAAARAGKGGLIPEMRRLAAGEIVLVGDLAHVPPTDLLNFLHQGRLSGVLYSRSEGVERALVLDDGNVSWGVSTSPAERFGEILARHGMLDREELARALKAQTGSASSAPGSVTSDGMGISWARLAGTRYLIRSANPFFSLMSLRAVDIGAHLLFTQAHTDDELR